MNSTKKVSQLLDEDSINPLPIIIERKRMVNVKSAGKAPHRARSATVSTSRMMVHKLTGAQKSLTIPTMFVWETKLGTFRPLFSAQ